MTATTTYPTIRNNWVTKIKGLTPGFLGVDFRLAPEMPADFRTWAEDNVNACLRKFWISRVGGREGALVTDEMVEQHIAEAELVVAYPKQWGKYNRSAARRGELDLEDALDSDGEQLAGLLGIVGAQNYVDGQSRCEAVYSIEEGEEQVNFLVVALEATFYRSVSGTDYPAMQSAHEQSWVWTAPSTGDSYTITIPRPMADATYSVSMLEGGTGLPPAGTADVGIRITGKTRNAFTIESSGNIVSGTAFDIIARDNA